MKNPVVKGWFTTILGILLVLLALAGYKFGWPVKTGATEAIVELLIGGVLLFVPPTAIEAALLRLFNRKVDEL